MTHVFRSMFFMVVTLASVNALAAEDCIQSDLKGTWYFMGVSGDSAFGEMAETDSCKVKVADNGSIVVSSSSCVLRNSAGKFSFPVVGGQLKINEFCSITGNIQYDIDGTVVRALIDSARLDSERSVIALIARANLNPDIIISFTGVKR